MKVEKDWVYNWRLKVCNDDDVSEVLMLVRRRWWQLEHWLRVRGQRATDQVCWGHRHTCY